MNVKTYATDKGVLFEGTDETGAILLDGHIDLSSGKAERVHTYGFVTQGTIDAASLEAERQAREGEIL